MVDAVKKRRTKVEDTSDEMNYIKQVTVNSRDKEVASGELHIHILSIEGEKLLWLQKWQFQID